jgi:hypothetical protein
MFKEIKRKAIQSIIIQSTVAAVRDCVLTEDSLSTSRRHPDITMRNENQQACTMALE